VLSARTRPRGREKRRMVVAAMLVMRCMLRGRDKEIDI
jgi:hypothetical protein